MAVALAIGVTGTAQAKVIPGTPGNDRIHGSRQADVINALAGVESESEGAEPSRFIIVRPAG